ncbi:DUF2971 domain-containing protein [Paenibacillus odorifer]|uniref:DUF2971 domain-containing protein n=1 Tax=Paenibacillus odorifer TaxID=189426 RepID=UPI000BA154FE|nr:DUF2971 domain-containing protein [Paenibacillus odorifer]OZQ66540.1 DUF2971 domain-containing protein [Paenibacillus odorifer]
MGYTYKQLTDRTASRSDMSMYLTHLTKGTDKLSSLDVLFKIINEQRIKGSDGSGFVIGDNTAACFQDAPLSGISQNVIHERRYRDTLGSKIRYEPFGISFSKRYIYKKGGRPCVYEDKETAKTLLQPSEWWRIVNYNLSDNSNIVDWTHEREWRVKGDFSFDLKHATILVPHDKEYRDFISRVDKELISKLQGIVVLSRTV